MYTTFQTLQQFKTVFITSVLLVSMHLGMYANTTIPTTKHTSVVSYVGNTKHFPAKQTYGVIGVASGKSIDNPADNYFTITLQERIAKTDKVWLVYDVKGVKSHTSISRQINDRFSTGGMLVEKSSDWATQKEAVSAYWFTKGRNTIQFSLPENVTYGYEIRNLEVVVEKAVAEEVVVEAIPISGTETIYVKGFINNENTQGATITIGNETITSVGGEFEGIVSNTTALTVAVRYANGEITTKDITVSKEAIQADYTHSLGTTFASQSFKFIQGTKGVFTTDNVVLEVEKNGLLASDRQISITPLRTIDMVALDFGMTNTTQGNGYRFLPHGTHFTEKGALVKMKYDRTKIPNGYTEEDIRTYYFDTNTGHWVALERKEINKKEQYIISETTHFTDMINGVIKTPESPESQAYTPTTISGIKAADPSSKVNLIQPPSANSNGIASVGYPIEVPPGRQGIQPSINVQYNSDGGSGWLGEGWDIAMPSISVETRWGVPRYNPTTETETYNLQGAMLAGVEGGKTFVAHKGKKVARKKDRQFYKRIAGSFERIIRRGDAPHNYTWEVTDKSGNKYFYGGVKKVDENAVLRGKTKINGVESSKENIAQWYLVRMIDANGNTLNYEYDAVTTQALGLPAKVVYCKAINYTGYKGGDGPYEVSFERVLGTSSRKDRRTNAKFGFLTMASDDLLKKINVTYDGEPVRSYEFGYKEGAFHKTLLDKITQFDADGEEFNSHTFEYYDDVQASEGYKPFDSVTSWQTGTDNIDAGLISGAIGSKFSDKIPVLGGGKTKSNSRSIYVGIGIRGGRTKKNTVGYSRASSSSSSKGLIAMVDINGDGLPDKVIDGGNTLYYRANTATRDKNGEVIFAEKTRILGGIDDFSRTKSSSVNRGPKIYPGRATLGSDKNRGTSTTSVYFSDVNSDGLIDIVKNGKVYFNRIVVDPTDNKKKPKFIATSAGTPSPIQGGGTIDISDTEVDDTEQEEFIKENPLQDVVRIWRAPYTGRVTIGAPVNLIKPTGAFEQDAYDKADGVRVAIQKNNGELWNTTIAKGDFSVKTPMNVTNIQVNKGDEIYFRVQSGINRKSNGAFDKVLWNPTITYTNKPALIDYNGNEVYSFKASEGNVFTYNTSFPIPKEVEKVVIKGNFKKPITTDDVRVKITDITTGSILIDSLYAWDKEVDMDILKEDIAFNKDYDSTATTQTRLKFELLSETNIAWNKVIWKPKLVFTIIPQADGVPSEPSIQEFEIPVHKNLLSKQVFAGAPYTVQQNDTEVVEVLPMLQMKTLSDTNRILPAVESDLSIVASVKKDNELVQKFNLIARKQTLSNDDVTFTLDGYVPTNLKNFKKNDTLWVEYSIPNPYLASIVTSANTDLVEKKIKLVNNEEQFISLDTISNIKAATYTVNTIIRESDINSGKISKEPEVKFGPMYRYWGQFAYNAMGDRAKQPIKRNLLKLPKDENTQPDPATDVFIMMVPDESVSYWKGYDPETYIYNDTISSSRLGEKDVILTNPLGDIDTTVTQDPNGTPAFGITKVNRNSSSAKMAGFMGASISTANGNASMETDFRDMNGDGYPDVITKSKIQYTNSRGGFDGERTAIGTVHYSRNSSKSIGFGGIPIHSMSVKNSGDGGANKNNSGQKSMNQAKNNGSISGSVGKSSNKDRTEFTFMDVNGDGLPDKIGFDKKVSINVGYGFLPPVTWKESFTQISTSESSYLNVGLGFDVAASSFAGGIGVNRGDNETNISLLDVNSDGLPDRVRRNGGTIYVGLNTGLGFEPERVWESINTVNTTSSTGESLNFAFTFSIPIPFTPIRIVFNPGGSKGRAANRNTVMLNDVDADGYLDFLSSKDDGSMQVKPSTIRNTNRLKTVKNPMGGQFSIAYERSEATYDHPRGKWVMASVAVKDGIADDGPDMKMAFDYKKGKYDRHERAFLGFGEVITKSIDTEVANTNDSIYYRAAKQQFDVSNYYKQGNLQESTLEDADGNIFTKNMNEYYSYGLIPNQNEYNRNNTLVTESGIGYHPMKYTKTESYEGGTEKVTLKESVYQYGNFGEVASYKYSDKGDLKASNYNDFNYTTTINYQDDEEPYIISLPTSVSVKDKAGKLYRQNFASYDTKGNLTQTTTKLNTTESAIVDIEYDRYGNIKKRMLSENHKGERMFYKYKYEGDLHTYVERIEDAFEYYTRFEKYDYRFGQVLQSQDINNFFIKYEVDAKGRMTKVTGPKELEKGLDYTIKFAYSPLGTTDIDGNLEPNGVPYALTQHYDPEHPGDDLETVTFMDGMARALQVKKEGVITTTDTNGSNPADTEVFIISGRVKYDAFGRAVETFYPTTEGKQSKEVFNPQWDNITPTKTTYDVQDRALTTTLPDGATTTMKYDVDVATNSLQTSVTDAEGNSKTSYTNGSNLILKVEEEQDIVTNYFYDPINQLTKVQDVRDNEIISVYDLAGRRTKVTHPDAGTTGLVYDKASNVLQKQTANLQEKNKRIQYEYDFNRLHKILYPEHPENNVTNYYGRQGASHNRVGRLVVSEDATGAQEFFYGNLGEIEKVIRTVVIPNNAIATFQTEFRYDTWNRLQEMIYPDQERIAYDYNTGGLLEKVTGDKTFTYNYLKKLGYDKFEQRTYLQYCNGAETVYHYEPERRRLTNLGAWTGTGYKGGGVRRQFMDNNYTYDKVSNVLSVENVASLPTAEKSMGGQMKHSYQYDNLYRLTGANGSYIGADQKTAQYSLAMTYDKLHNITSKEQHIQQTGVTFDGKLSAGYKLNYEYGAKPHQIASIDDENYRTEGDDERKLKKKENVYTYDANGNQVYISKNKKKDEMQNDRKLSWDEENRLLGVSDNGFVSVYTYDASGERVTKLSGNGEAVHVNALASGGRTQTDKYTAYINPYFVLSSGGQYTKHIMIGSQRMVSKLGDIASFGEDPRRIKYAGDTEGIKIDYDAKYKSSQQVVKDQYAGFEVPYYGKDNDDYQGGTSFCCDTKNRLAAKGGTMENEDPELYQYYYHPDHLGSSSYITNLDGDIAQHIEYVPFGEVFIEERNNSWNTPYKFNGKELDEETGLSYYGARYYNSRESIWLSVDPLAEKYPTWSPYNYTLNNPVKLVDYDGLEPTENNFLNGLLDSPFVNDVLDSPYVEGIEAYRNLDEKGHELFNHWLSGSGESLILGSDDWGQYMRDNTILSGQIQEQLLRFSEDNEEAIKLAENDLFFKITFHGEIENGYSSGYEFLHGSNSDLGDVQIAGNVRFVPESGQYIFEIQNTWNDRIDPNSTYEKDEIFSNFLNNVGNPQDYNLRIIWDDTIIIPE